VQWTVPTYLQITLHQPTAPSGPPINVVATALSATAVMFSWQSPALLDQNGVITSYQVVLVYANNGTRRRTFSVDGLTVQFEGIPL